MAFWTAPGLAAGWAVAAPKLNRRITRVSINPMVRMRVDLGFISTFILSTLKVETLPD
jgi:hypothetical protein